MKKIIYAMAAALTLAGCQKVNDIETRVKDLETDVTSLQSEVSKLQTAVDQNYAISSFEKTADGYVLKLTNGSSITLKMVTREKKVTREFRESRAKREIKETKVIPAIRETKATMGTHSSRASLPKTVS